MVSGGIGGVGSSSDIGVGGSSTSTVGTSTGKVGTSTGKVGSSTGTVGSTTDMDGSSTGISELTTLELCSVSSCLEVGSSISSVSGTASVSEGAGGSAKVVVIVGVVSSADVLGSAKTTAGPPSLEKKSVHFNP